MALHYKAECCTKQQYPTNPLPSQGRSHRNLQAAAQQRQPGNARSTPGQTMPQPISQTRIIKKLAPGDAGTKRLSQRFGPDLVCVRYRQDREARRRYTTVEIMVDSGPLATTPLLRSGQLVRIGLNEPDLRQAAAKLGAVWDPQQQAWRMNKEAVKRLQLEQRLLKK